MTQPGQKIQQWILEAPLGQGGFASVWSARHALLHNRAALKLLDAELAADPALRDRFLAEGRILAQLRHPNLVRVTDVLVDGADVGLVMDLVEGEPADALLGRGPVDTESVIAIVRGVCDGLIHAHEHGIVHRDIKPENIVLVEDAAGLRPTVIDFGIAKVLDTARIITEREGTRERLSIGTPGYMAPEQIRGGAIDARTDVFAVGAVVAEALTGAAAFQGTTTSELHWRVSQGDAHLPDDLGPALQGVLRRALHPEPGLRQPDMRTLKRELLAALERRERRAAVVVPRRTWPLWLAAVGLLMSCFIGPAMAGAIVLASGAASPAVQRAMTWWEGPPPQVIEDEEEPGDRPSPAEPEDTPPASGLPVPVGGGGGGGGGWVPSPAPSPVPPPPAPAPAPAPPPTSPPDEDTAAQRPPPASPTPPPRLPPPPVRPPPTRQPAPPPPTRPPPGRQPPTRPPTTERPPVTRPPPEDTPTRPPPATRPPPTTRPPTEERPPPTTRPPATERPPPTTRPPAGERPTTTRPPPTSRPPANERTPPTSRQPTTRPQRATSGRDAGDRRPNRPERD